MIKTKHIIFATVIGFVVPFIFLIMRLISGEFLLSLDTALADASLRSKHFTLNQDIIIVEIDERTEKNLGELLNYPQIWLERFLEKCNSPKAVCITFPLHFPEKIPKEVLLPVDSLAKVLGISSMRVKAILRKTLQIKKSERLKKLLKEKNVYFGFEITDKKYSNEILVFDIPIWKIPKKLKTTIFMGRDFNAPSKEYLVQAKEAGYINLIPDEDGVVRKIPLMGVIKKDTIWKIKKDTFGKLDHFYLSLPLAVIKGIKHIKTIQIPDMYHIALDENLLEVEPPNLSYRLMFVGRKHHFRTYSLWDIIHGRNPKNFKNKIVILGKKHYKTYPTPISKSMPSYVIHANAIAGLLEGKRIIKSSIILDFIISLLFSSIAAFSILVKLRKFAAPLFFILLVIFYIICYSCVKVGYWISFFHPFFTSLTTLVISLLFWIIDEGKTIPLIHYFSYKHRGKIDEKFIMEVSGIPYVKKEEKVSVTLFFNFKKGKKSLKDISPYLVEIEELFHRMVFKYGGMPIITETPTFTALFGGDRAVMNAATLSTELRRNLRNINARCTSDNIGELIFGIGISKGETTIFKTKPFPHVEFLAMGKPIYVSRELAFIASEQKKEIVMDDKVSSNLPKGSLKEEIGELSILGEKFKVYSLMKIQ